MDGWMDGPVGHHVFSGNALSQRSRAVGARISRPCTALHNQARPSSSPPLQRRPQSETEAGQTQQSALGCATVKM